MKIRSVSRVVSAAIALSLLPGCGDWFQSVKKRVTGDSSSSTHKAPSGDHTKSTDKGEVLAYIDGKPAVYKKEFEQQAQQYFQAMPQLQGQQVNIDNLPATFKENLVDALVKQKLIVKWGEKNNVEQDARFQEQLQETVELIKQRLVMSRFQERVAGGIEVSDADVRKAYEDQKKQMVKEQGGVVIAGVTFSKPQEAQAFYNKVRKENGEFVDASTFAKLGKDVSGGTYKTFGRVAEDTLGVPRVVKNAAKATLSFPAAKYVPDVTQYWVLHMSDKKDTTYYSFDDVKGRIEGMLKQQKVQEKMEQELNKLEKEYDVKIVKEALAANDANNEDDKENDAADAKTRKTVAA